jgi:ABC-2 type transport system permease protein
MYAYVRLELTRTVRDVTFVIFGIALPVVMYLIFTNIGLTSGDHHDAALFAMVGMAAYGGMGAAFNNGTGLAEDRAMGWLRQLRLTPLSSLQVLAGKATTGMVIVVPAIIAVLLAGSVLNGVSLNVVQWLTIIVLLWLGTLPFTLLGLANGYRFSGQTAGVVNFSANMGLAVLGGLWLPASSFPGWLQAISNVTPTHAYADLSWQVAFGAAPKLGSIAVLVGWLVVFGIYAQYAYRRAGRYAR